MEKIIREALRYLGIREPDAETRRAVETAAGQIMAQTPPRFVYRVFPVEQAARETILTGAGITLAGTLAADMLRDCGQAALLLCTLGAGFERMLRACQARDMARAVILDACGSAIVESGCDAAEREIADRFPGLYLSDRFSPGYGDLPLALQMDILRALDGERRLGVTVTDACLLNPMKTVTAVIGLAERPQPAKIRGCAYCVLRETCAYRKRGNVCGK